MYLKGESQSGNTSFLQAKDKGNLNAKIGMQRDALVKWVSIVLTDGKVAASSDKGSETRQTEAEMLAATV